MQRGSALQLLILLALCAAGLVAPAPCDAQSALNASSEKDLIDWYYAAFFGTGVYRSGDRTVSVLQIPFSKELQPLEADHVGLRLTLPVSFGFYDFSFDSLLGGNRPHSLSTVSVLPGIEAEIPVTRSWTLKPYANVGQGRETSGEATAWIYAAGVKSRIAMPIGKDSELSLENQLTLMGYRPSDAPSQSLGLFVTGLNLSVPSSLRLWDRAASVDYHLIHYYYFNPLSFPTWANTENKISGQSEFGVSLKMRTPVALKMFDIDRIGLAFRIGGGISGVRLFFNLPY
jgi:hypothetical protein